MSNLSALKTELLSGHPITGAYNVDNTLAAAEINALNIIRIRDLVDGGEILNVTDDVEFSALTAAQQDKWLALCGVESINTSSGVAKALEAELFGVGTATRTNLVAVRQETISRVTELGLGRVTYGTVETARDL